MSFPLRFPIHRALVFGLLLTFPLVTTHADDAQIRTFLEEAGKRHGDAGAKAAQFLVDGMPQADRDSLKADFLIENLDLAFKAREEFPWVREVPEEIFLNDVLPYAVFDETRESWRAEFLEKGRKIVAGCKTATEAAQAINREFFNLVNVHYNTGRKKTNQSPSESIGEGRATCTGLTILYVDACRSVGVPARAAGIFNWTTKDGNHTWPEVWDGRWHFTGADEYDAHGLDRGWFVEDASKADGSKREHAIFATSWRKDGEVFPMVWSPDSRSVGAVNVTDRYAKPSAPATAEAHVRLSSGEGADARIEADAVLIDDQGKEVAKARTKAGRADRNDMAVFSIEPGRTYSLRLTRGGVTREAILKEPGTLDLVWEDLAVIPAPVLDVEAWLAMPADSRGDAPATALTTVEAEKVRDLLWADLRSRLQKERGPETRERTITLGDKTLRFKEKIFGKEPEGGHSLWISLHGGGGVPAEINDQQWQNQVDLYQLAEGICVAPRGPTNNWNLWHEAHMDPLLSRLIEDFIVLRGVNPERIYIMGYSAGGDGVYQLAPRMADRFAAAGMMAGHPNDSSPASLRNLPFALLMGGEDAAYDRNKRAAEWQKLLDDLEKKEGGYPHFVRIYPGLGHWMNRKDAEAIPWMAGHSRETWPKQVVWEQGNVPSTRFYWLSLPGQSPKKGDRIDAEVDGQTIRIKAPNTNALTLRLSDDLVNLDKDVVVDVNGKRAFEGSVKRTASATVASLAERADPSATASAELALSW